MKCPKCDAWICNSYGAEMAQRNENIGIYSACQREYNKQKEKEKK